MIVGRAAQLARGRTAKAAGASLLKTRESNVFRGSPGNALAVIKGEGRDEKINSRGYNWAVDGTKGPFEHQRGFMFARIRCFCDRAHVHESLARRSRS